MKKHTIYLKELNACQEAVKWASQFPTLQQAWDICERGDWMLWLIGKQLGGPGSDKRKQLVLTACKCSRLSLKYVPRGEKRPLKAIQVAEKRAKGIGHMTLNDVKNAAAVAIAAVVAIADAAYAAAYAAADAAYAADYATAARKDTLKKCADIVRKDYPKISMTKT